MVAKELLDEIKSELQTRATWETRQSDWYRMRYEGIKRSRPPYPGAPDTHYALCDSMIDKLRPFYLAQLYGQERLATFLSNKPQASELTVLAERGFDYTLKQQSNFEPSIFVAIDRMLTYGRGPVKIHWNVDKKRLEFSPILPIYLVVPSWTEDLCDADWSMHILHMSESQYRANSRYNQDKDFIKRIKGRGVNEGTSLQQEQEIKTREGITCGQNDNQIVIWEIYSREGGKIMVDTISPIISAEEQVRDTFALPYKHGEMPFCDLRYEITDPDYYAPRGVVEILQQDELELCKLRNHKLEFLDFFGRPMFENTGTSGTTGNFNPGPGKILPQGLKALIPTSAPLDYVAEMEMQRALAEDRVQVPNYSANEHLSGAKGAKGQVTATQINAIASQSGAGNDMRARIFRLQLATMYRQAWSIKAQFSQGQTITLEDYTEVPLEAVHDDYNISPSGSADSFNKEQRVQKALAYYQVLRGNPCVPPPGITKWLLEQDDPDLVKRLFKDPGLTQENEAEQQALETLLMMSGRDVPVKPGDTDSVHLQEMAHWGQSLMMKGTPPTPETAAKVLNHAAGHIQQAHAKKDQQAIALARQLQPMISMLAQIAQSGAQPGAALPQPGAQPVMPPQPAPAQGGQQQHESISINYKDAPPSVQRQMEIAAGFAPATPGEHAMQIGNQMPKPPVQPKQKPE